MKRRRSSPIIDIIIKNVMVMLSPEFCFAHHIDIPVIHRFRLLEHVVQVILAGGPGAGRGGLGVERLLQRAPGLDALALGRLRAVLRLLRGLGLRLAHLATS